MELHKVDVTSCKAERLTNEVNFYQRNGPPENIVDERTEC